MAVLPPFQHLIDAHWRDVTRLAHALAGPVHGDDVAQQAWEKAYASYPSLRSTANLRGWLLTITHRCAMDVHRRRGRLVLVADPAEPAERTGAQSEPPATPRPELWSAVAALPVRQREAVVLKYVADLDHTSIADVLGVSPAMSRRLVSDALSALRVVIEREDES